MGKSSLRVIALGLALTLGACSKYAFFHMPEIPPAPDASFYDRLDLSLGIWEQVTTEGNEFVIGHRPSYIEPLKTTLDRMNLFGDIAVAPWRPQRGDVLLKITDRAEILQHNDYNAARLWGIFLLAGLPSTFLKLRTGLHSELMIESESVPSVEPLKLSGVVETELKGKLLSFYGSNDRRLELGQQHSAHGAELMAAWLRAHYEWFRQARKVLPARSTAKPAGK